MELRVTDHIIGQVKQLEKDLFSEWDGILEAAVINSDTGKCPAIGVHSDKVYHFLF